jgi:exo-beta-1,3-glucanase (GH17 family)
VDYSPSQLDPQSAENSRRLLTSSIRADLQALRPTFDGLVLYGYDQASTPRILAVAKDLKFRVILLGIWDPKSADEIDGVARLVQLFGHDFAIGVIIGNEGLTMNRYEKEDIVIARARLRDEIPDTVPVTTSEPLAAYSSDFVQDYGDFAAPNIHSVFDRKTLHAKEAADWARGMAVSLSQHCHKPVILKETGFPHGGAAGYTEATQLEFWTEFTGQPLLVRSDQSKEEWTFLGVAFEAFDSIWKTKASGLEIENAWGILDSKRQPYPALSAWSKLKTPTAVSGPTTLQAK